MWTRVPTSAKVAAGGYETAAGRAHDMRL